MSSVFTYIIISSSKKISNLLLDTVLNGDGQARVILIRTDLTMVCVVHAMAMGSRELIEPGKLSEEQVTLPYSLLSSCQESISPVCPELSAV